MLFVFTGIDRRDSARLRDAKLSAHLEYLRAGNKVRLAGPLLDKKGAMVGTLLIIEAENRAVAEAWCLDEPFCRSGLFTEQRLFPWLRMCCTLDKAPM